MKKRNLFFACAIFLLMIGVFAEDDLGQQTGSYALKDGKKIWLEDRTTNRIDLDYGKDGLLVKTKRLDTLLELNKYEFGLLREQTNASGATRRVNYDSMGRVVEKISPIGKTELKYDKYGRMIERKGTGEYPMNFTYTNWGEVAGYTNGNKATTRFEYNQNGKLVKRICPNGASIQFTYAGGRLINKEEVGRKTSYFYDQYGRMLEEKITQDERCLITRMTYNKFGQLSVITDGNHTIKFAYDRLGRKLMEEGPIGTVRNKFDAKGRLVARETQFRGSKGAFLTEYDYDGHDRLVSVTSPSGIFCYTWTQSNKIATQSVGNKLVRNEYDQAGRLVSKEFEDTVLTKYQYDLLDRRVKGQYFDEKWNYSYDQYSQIVSATSSLGKSFAYSYDLIGNRLSATEDGKTHNLNYNGMNQIAADGYVYDAWGNMIQSPVATYTYDLKNRLIQVKKTDGTVVHYEYSPLSQRITSTINGRKTTFLMSGMTELARNNGTPQYHTLGLDLLGTLEQTGGVGAILATNDIQYLYDGNGNVSAAVKDGQIIDKLSYAPFGKQISGLKLPFSFSSKFTDASGLSYYGYRFYDSSLGKWLSTDLLAEQGGMNFYAFVNNSTLNAIDAFGAVPIGTTVGNAIWDGTKWVTETTVQAGVTSGNATWDGTKWVASTTVAAGTSVGGVIWDGLKWLGDGVVAVGTTVGSAIWDGTQWVTNVVVSAGTTAGNATWDGTKWVTTTTVEAGIWVGEEIWDGAKWSYAKTMEINLGNCGSAKWNRVLIPDAPLGFDFSECCEKHDECYDTKCEKKSLCDSAFYNCMDSKAKAASAWYRPGKIGTGFAGIFYFSVDIFACSAYKNAQIVVGNKNPTCD